MTIWFDMDGTIADLYGVDNWLEQITDNNERPFVVAKPLVNVKTFERLLKKLQDSGNEIGIVTCLPKNYKKTFYKKVVRAKKEWLETHLKNIKFDKIVFLDYEDIKNQVNEGEDVLFDDEERHLKNWTGTAVEARYMIETIKKITK